MATGRTTKNWVRAYVDGYDLSGWARKVGPLTQEVETAEGSSLADVVKNVLLGSATLGVGSLNVFMDPATGSAHLALATVGVKRTIMVPVGIRGNPAAGDPVVCGEFDELNYKAEESDGFMVATAEFGMTDPTDAALGYPRFWGTLLHAKSAETAVNTATGLDNAAATTGGGFLCYQVFAGNGTATIKVQDAAVNTNPSFSDLAGATSGVIDCSTPKAGIVALATTATVRQYLRWQIVLGTATSLTFALAFVRG